MSRAVTARDALQERVRGLPASSPLLVAAERIDVLLEGIGRFRKDRDDLPGLQGQLAASRGSLAGLLERLGMDESRARGATDAQLVVVEDLVQARTALDAQAGLARRASWRLLSTASRRRSRELQELPEAPDVEALALVVAVGRSFLERERQAGKERGEIGGLEGDLEVQGHRLGLPSVELDALERLPAPATASLRDHRQSRLQLESRSARPRAAGRGHRVCSESDVTPSWRRSSPIPRCRTPVSVETARGRRDEGWTWYARPGWTETSTTRGEALGGGDSPLADAFEGSIQPCRSSGRRSFQHATQSPCCEQLAATGLAELADKMSRCGAEQDEIVEAGRRLEAEWRALWEPVGVCPGRSG